MSLQKQLADDFIKAIKEKDQIVVLVLRMLKAAIQNKKIEKKISKNDALSDTDIVAIIKSEIKKRNDSITDYQAGGREDLAAKERAEAVILKKYLPEQMSDEQVREVVQEVITAVGAGGAGDFGKVMGAVMAKTNGQADGQLVAKIVKEELSQ